MCVLLDHWSCIVWPISLGSAILLWLLLKPTTILIYSTCHSVWVSGLFSLQASNFLVDYFLLWIFHSSLNAFLINCMIDLLIDSTIFKSDLPGKSLGHKVSVKLVCWSSVEIYIVVCQYLKTNILAMVLLIISFKISVDAHVMLLKHIQVFNYKTFSDAHKLSSVI